MKKNILFSVLALLGLCTTASAEEVTDVDFSAVSYEWYPKDVATRYQGPARMVDGAYVVYVRSEEQARAAGNATLDNGNFASWDSQFFIDLGEGNELKAGDRLILQMELKADVAATVETQSHGAPGAYKHYQCIGNVTFTSDEWNHFYVETDVPSNLGLVTGTRTIAFNLAKTIENTYYFKIKKVQIERAPEVEFVSIIDNDERCFFKKESPSQNVFHAAEDINGVIAVESAAKADGNGDDWDSQFWIRLPQQLPSGTTFKVSFDYKASEASTVGTQSHNNPGGYLHWACIGNVEFASQWKTFSGEISVPSECGNNFRSIAFNLSKSDAITYYFRNIKVEIPENVLAQPDYLEIAPELTLTLDDDDIRVGDEVTATVSVTNDQIIGGAQFDITLPDGLELVAGSEEKNTDRVPARGYGIQMARQQNGAIRFLVANSGVSLKNIEGHEGALISFNLLATDVTEGEIVVDNISLTGVNPDDSSYDIEVDDVKVPVTVSEPDPVLDGNAIFGSSEDQFGIQVGDTHVVEITLENDVPLAGIEAFITLPNGLTIEKNDENELFTYTDRIPYEWVINDNEKEDGYKITISGISQDFIEEGQGTLFSFTVKCDESFSEDGGDIVFSDITVSTPSAQSFDLDDEVVISVTNETISTAIKNIDSTNGKAEIFDLSGRRVNNAKGVVVVRANGQVRKVVK